MTTDTLAFLDACGRDPALLDDYTAAVAALDLPEAETRALLARDRAAIAESMGLSLTMMCLVMEPQREGDEPAPEKAPDDAPDDDAPEQR